MDKKESLSEEMLELAGRIAPPMREIQQATGVSRTTIFHVLKGKSDNQAVIKYLKSYLDEELPKIKSISTEILKKAG